MRYMSRSQGGEGEVRARGGRSRGLSLAFSTPLSRSDGRPASQAASFVFFVYFLFLFV